MQHRDPAKPGWPQRGAFRSLTGSSIGSASISATSSSRPMTSTATASTSRPASKGSPSPARSSSPAASTSRSSTSWSAVTSCSAIARSRTSPIRSGSIACCRMRPPINRTRRRRETILLTLLGVAGVIIAGGVLWYMLQQPRTKPVEQARAPTSSPSPSPSPVAPSPPPAAKQAAPAPSPAPTAQQPSPQPQPAPSPSPVVAPTAAPSRPVGARTGNGRRAGRQLLDGQQ